MYMRKSAKVSGKQALGLLNTGAEWLGKLFVHGKSSRQGKSLKRLSDLSGAKSYADDASELRRIARVQLADALLGRAQKAEKKAQRIAGYTAAGSTIPLYLSYRLGASGKDDLKNQLSKSEQELDALRQSEADLQQRYNDETQQTAAAAKTGAAQAAIVGAGVVGGGALGALIDRRNRLRGLLLGSVTGGGAALALGTLTPLADKLHEHYSKQG